MSPKVPSYLRTHRLSWSLTQQELAFLLGLGCGSQISKFECAIREPTIRATVGCQVIFGVSASQLLPGLLATVEQDVIERARLLQDSLADEQPTEALRRKVELLQAVIARSGSKPSKHI